MNGFDRLRVSSRNANLCATFDLLVMVFDFSLRPLHRLNTRRSLRVNDHRRGEIPFGKHLSNMLEMPADLIAAGHVITLNSRDLNNATILIEAKMMPCLDVRKTHCVVSTFIHLFVSFYFAY